MIVPLGQSLRAIQPPIAILGAGGMLGRAFRDLLTSLDIPHRALSRADADIRDARAMRRIDAPLVINCAAWTDVDGAETREEEALAVNAGPGLAALSEGLSASGGLLVHFSTDYVFDGAAREPYPTDHPRAPINAYGRTKSAGEAIIEASARRHLIVRTSWLYAPWGRNFVRTIACLCAQRESLRVVDDQVGRPTSCEHLARTTLALLDAGASGTFHATDGGRCSWFEFAREIARLSGSSCRIEPCATREFPRPAPRPAWSVLDISKTEAIVGTMGDWRDNLAHVLRRLEP